MLDRVTEKIEVQADGCWLWTGQIDIRGYGVIAKPGKRNGVMKAHRAVYELTLGPIPEGLHLHHRCWVRACVNPKHLVAVTPTEHHSRWGSNALKTHCYRGHPFDEANTFIDRRGRRRCRECCRARNRAAYARAKGFQYTDDDSAQRYRLAE